MSLAKVLQRHSAWLTLGMWNILVTWMNDVILEEKFSNPKIVYKFSLYILTKYLTRVLPADNIERVSYFLRVFQLLGTASFWISTKLLADDFDTVRITAKTCVMYTDDGYTVKELIDMERAILKVLNYRIIPKKYL